MGRVILNILNERRKALPFLCHYSPQMHIMIDTDFFNKLNAPNKSFKSMIRLTEFELLKRMSEYNLESLVSPYETFAQLIECSPNLVGSERCKLKKINLDISGYGIVYNLMRQEGTETLPRKLPIIIDLEFQRKISLHFPQ